MEYYGKAAIRSDAGINGVLNVLILYRPAPAKYIMDLFLAAV